MDHHQLFPRQALVVEDELLIRLDLEDYLIGRGFEVQGFGDPRSAEQALDGRPFDIAILDLSFGGMDDVTALAAGLRARGVPLIFCSGSGQPPAGFEDAPLVHKPYLEDDLMQAMRRALAAAATEA